MDSGLARTAVAWGPRRYERQAQYWRLLWRWTLHDLNGRYGRSTLRAAWTVLQPFLFVAVYVVVFGVIFDGSGGDLPYLTYFLGGMVVYRVVSAGLATSSCLSDNVGLLSRTPMPAEVIPLGMAAVALLDAAFLLVGLGVVAAAQGVELHLTVMLTPLVLVGALSLAGAVTVAISTIHVFVKDTQFAGIVLMQLLFFTSPIAYLPSQLPSELRFLDTLNPISVYIEALRDVALRGVAPNWPLLLVHLVVSVALAVAAVAHLRAVEHRMVDLG